VATPTQNGFYVSDVQILPFLFPRLLFGSAGADQPLLQVVFDVGTSSGKGPESVQERASLGLHVHPVSRFIFCHLSCAIFV
jgi:hypothetical protein